MARSVRCAPRALAAGLLVLAVAGCGGGSSGGGAGPLDVVASFYPLAEVARQVGGDRVRVVDLTPPGVEPHDLELSTGDVEELEGADVILYLGGGFQPAVEKVAERSDATAVDVIAGARAARQGGGGRAPTEGDDPHIWLDPVRMRQIVDVTQEAFSEADPPGAAGYAERADAYRRQLDDLDAEYRAGLATCARRVVITAHEAFAYLSSRYGLQNEGAAGISPEAEPDPRRLAELADLVRRTGSTTVFTESLVSPRVAETLAREAGVRTAVLDPVESLSDTEIRAGESYVTAMRGNLSALREALGCT